MQRYKTIEHERRMTNIAHIPVGITQYKGRMPENV